MNESETLLKIREKLRRGILSCHVRPHADPNIAINIGCGTGKPCDGCERAILETEARIIYDDSIGKVISFHNRCADIFHEECQRRLAHPD